MTDSKNLHQATVGQLVDLFVNICVSQYAASDREEYARYNRLYRQMERVLLELKSRPGDQRRALQSLFGHGNLQVRLMAAHANLTIDYERSRAEFAAIEATHWMPQAANAGMALEDLDTGFYKPT